jgi:hypothetical protein
MSNELDSIASPFSNIYVPSYPLVPTAEKTCSKEFFKKKQVLSCESTSRLLRPSGPFKFLLLLAN